MQVSQRKLGVILSYAAQGINILSGLLYTPIMLQLLGQSEYGLYQLVCSVISYLSLLSFGFSGSYARFYSRLKAREDKKEIESLNGMFMTIFLCITCVCIASGVIMIANIECIFGNGLTMQEYSTARILMVLMVLNLAMTFPNTVYDSFISVHERFFFQRIIIVMQYIFNPFLTLPLLLMGYGSIAMVLVTTGLTLGKLVLNIWYSIKKLNMKFNFRRFKFSLLKEMWIFTFFIFINLIVDQINWNVDKFLLGRFVGTVSVAIYGISSQLNAMYLQFSTSISSVYIPKVNKIVAETNDNILLTKLFTKVGRIQFVILALVFSGFVFFGQPFIQLWVGNEYEYSYFIALLLMGPVTIPLIQNLGIEIQRAKNMHKVRSVVYIMIAVSNIFVSIPCIKMWGAQGAAFGTALTLILGNGIFMNWYYHNRIELDIVFFWKEIIKFIPALILPFVFGIFIIRFVKIPNLLILTLLGIIYIIIYGISMWFLGLNNEEKQMIISLFNKKLNRLSI